jgi:hypothetical protein
METGNRRKRGGAAAGSEAVAVLQTTAVDAMSGGAAGDRDRVNQRATVVNARR